MNDSIYPQVACSRITGAIIAALTLGALASHVAAAVLIAPVVTGSATPFNPSYDAANTVDQTEFDYASQGLGVDTFVEFTFPSPQNFDRIVVMNRDSPGLSDLIGDFTLTFDGGPITESILRTPQRGSSKLHSLSAPRTTTTVRLDVDTIGVGDSFNNTGAMEVIFMRTPAGQLPITGVTVVNSAPAFVGAPAFFAAENVVDGDVGRSSDPASTNGPEYASNGQGANTFVDFNLGAVVPLGAFDFFDRPADEDRVTGFDMIFSLNATFGDADDVVRSYTNSSMALGDEFAPIFAQYVRYDVTAHNPVSTNTGMSEIVFYKTPEPSAAVLLLTLGFAVVVKRRRG